MKGKHYGRSAAKGIKKAKGRTPRTSRGRSTGVPKTNTKGRGKGTMSYR